MTDQPRTWHYGLMAEWWAHFNTDGGRELAYFHPFVEAGEPALDAGCGSGRLLVPWLRDGIDVDGCDVSADMVAQCRARAEAEGLSPTLWVQPLHELAPPSLYRTIVVCGAFGLGTTRTQDEEAIRRLYASLEPGGTLLLDNEVPYSSTRRWMRWTAEGRADLPRPWSEEPDRRTAPDGSEYSLWTRMLEVDPLDQSVRLEMRIEKRRDGELVAEDEHPLLMRMWFRDELVLMLRTAGFSEVAVRGGYDGEVARPDHDFLVFIARK
jgi:SAM-dependent methyltransferase